MTSKLATLAFDVYVAEGVPINASAQDHGAVGITNDPPPGERRRLWSPISATLISGDRDAVLADALMTIEQARGLADWIAASGKNLTTVYITHGHGDHWFGLGPVLERFPEARAVALPSVVEYIRRSSTPQQLAASWEQWLPGQIPDPPVLAEPLEGHAVELEGHQLAAVEVGHTDTDDTTVLHVPDIGLVVAGDAAYNDVHLHLGESPPELRREWIAALDTIESLNPTAVVAGHKRPGRADDPQILEETRRYIRDFDAAANDTSTAQQLYERMLALYPKRVNPGALWSSARGVKPG
jgi:glyoxylase-like metal-dependent hydrolase (beta-lactamase superfamily II)